MSYQYIQNAWYALIGDTTLFNPLLEIQPRNEMLRTYFQFFRASKSLQEDVSLSMSIGK